MAASPARSVSTAMLLESPPTIWTRVDSAAHSLAQQLVANPHRVRTSTRMALMAALCASLSAAFHIDEPLGVYVIWSLISAPAAMMLPLRGVGFVLLSALLLAISLPLAGTLGETPWLLVPFFSVTTAAWSYYFSDADLSNGWRVVEIIFITTFFIVVFDPKNFGWSVGYTFGGTCVAFGIVMLFDNVIWPDPADVRLLQLLHDTTSSLRQRLALAGHAYLDPQGTIRFPATTLGGSALSVHLALLSRADRENLGFRRHALLLGGVSAAERRRIEIERLLGIAREPVPRAIRGWIKPEMQAVLDALDAGLAAEAAHLAGDFYHSDPPETVAAVENTLTALNQRSAQLHQQYVTQAGAEELSNLSAFIVGMERLSRLLRHPPIAVRDTPRKPATPARDDPAKLRYCTKLAVAVALAFMVAVTSQRADLKTTILTVMIAGVPTYGGSLHKMMLRFLGVAMGGVVSLAAIVASSPNFETILSYLIVCFVAFYIASYIGLGGGGLGYAGKQIGTTFALVFIALSPSTDVTAPLYRLWGVFLGVIVLALVFLIIAPDYAGESMVPRLKKMLESVLALMPDTSRNLSEDAIQAIEIDSAKTLGELLEIADDARIEGRRAIVDPDAIIETVGTLRRIIHRLASGAIALNQIELPRLPPQLEAARAQFNRTLVRHFRDCLDFVGNGAQGISRSIPAWNEAAARGLLNELEREIAADNFAALSGLRVHERRTLLAEVENFRRLTVLAGELSEQLAHIQPGELAEAAA